MPEHETLVVRHLWAKHVQVSSVFAVGYFLPDTKKFIKCHPHPDHHGRLPECEPAAIELSPDPLPVNAKLPKKGKVVTQPDK